LAFAQQTPAPAAPPASAAARGDARFGIVNLQVVFNESTLGRQSLVQVRALEDKLRSELDARAKEIQGLSEKIKTQGSVAAPSALATWNTDLLRLQRAAQFAQQEAEIQVQQLMQALQEAFSAKVTPVIESLRAERGLSAVFGVQGAEAPGSLTLLAIDPSVNLSNEVVSRLNAQGAPR
jgi:Skp family chaperone for outer membrane proteins